MSDRFELFNQIVETDTTLRFLFEARIREITGDWRSRAEKAHDRRKSTALKHLLRRWQRREKRGGHWNIGKREAVWAYATPRSADW